MSLKRVRREFLNGALIVADVIRAQIINELDRGHRALQKPGGMSGAEQTILYCVVTRLEIGGVQTIVRRVLH